MTRRRALVARLDSDGDVLLSGPAVRAVAARVARVTLLCGPRGEQAARLLPGVDEVVVWRCPWIDPEPPAVLEADVLGLVETLRAQHLTDAVILTSFHQSALPTALLLRLAGTARITAISDDFAGSLLDVRHKVAEDLHEVQRALSVAGAAGFPLPPGDDGRLAVTRSLSEPPPDLPGRFVVVHPGASVPARAWQPERCRDLVTRLVARGYDVVVTGGPGERPLTAAVAGGDALDLGGRTTLAELAGVLERAECVVVGNTGPAHLAAAVGTPVVSLFAPVVPARKWRPWRVPHVLLGDQHAACRDSRARECPLPRHPCLGSVTADDALAAVESLLPARVRA